MNKLEPGKWYLVGHTNIPDTRKVMEYKPEIEMFIGHDGHRWCEQHVTVVGTVSITYF